MYHDNNFSTRKCSFRPIYMTTKMLNFSCALATTAFPKNRTKCSRAQRFENSPRPCLHVNRKNATIWKRSCALRSHVYYSVFVRGSFSKHCCLYAELFQNGTKQKRCRVNIVSRNLTHHQCCQGTYIFSFVTLSHNIRLKLKVREIVQQKCVSNIKTDAGYGGEAAVRSETENSRSLLSKTANSDVCPAVVWKTWVLNAAWNYSNLQLWQTKKSVFVWLHSLQLLSEECCTAL